MAQRTESSPPESPPSRHAHPSRGRVLIVDDEAMIREILCEKLISEGYQCFTATNALEAVVRLSENAPDLVLLDVMMPGKSGVEVLAELKALEPHISVIMVTAVQDVDTAIETMKIGADDYLLKPFKLSEVVISVQKAISKRHHALANVNYQISLENEVAEQTRELKTLNQISETLNRTLDLETILGTALEQVMDLTELGWGGIYLLDTEFNELRLATVRGPVDRPEDLVTRLAVGQGVVGRVAQHGGAEVADGSAGRSDFEDGCVLMKGIQVFAAIPLRSKASIVGVLVLGSSSYRRFSEREIDLLKAICIQAGMAIENANLYGKEKREAEISATLLEIGRTMNGTLDTSELTIHIVNAVKELVKADDISVWLVDRTQGDCVLQGCYPENGLYRAGSRQPSGKGIAGWSAVHGEAFLVRRTGVEIGPISYEDEESAISSYISIPLTIDRTTLGVIVIARLAHDEPFRHGDMGPVMLLAGQAGVVLENARLFQEVRRQTEAVRDANFDTIKALAETLETKDAYTRGHSDRAVLYAVEVGKRLSLSEPEMEWLKYAAVFHDIGKIGIPDSILNKPAKLTEEEYEVMKTHPQKGAEILREIKFLAPVVPLVLYHQERYDGKGYPAGLKGEEIPIQSRIVAVLDAYDAMTSNRIYRKAPGKEYAIQELKRCSGTQFDPRVVEAFINVLSESDQK